MEIFLPRYVEWCQLWNAVLFFQTDLQPDNQFHVGANHRLGIDFPVIYMCTPVLQRLSQSPDATRLPRAWRTPFTLSNLNSRTPKIRTEMARLGGFTRDQLMEPSHADEAGYGFQPPKIRKLPQELALRDQGKTWSPKSRYSPLPPLIVPGSESVHRHLPGVKIWPSELRFIQHTTLGT